jgi:acyl-CoA thioester hydrolase
MHRLEVTAAPDDVDMLGHVSNLVFVRWVQEAAAAHSGAAGWDLEAYKRLGTVFVVRRHEIDYLAPAFAGDRVALATWVESWEAASSIRRTSITRAHDGRELARAATTWVFVSLDSGRPRRIPPEVRDAFARTRA